MRFFALALVLALVLALGCAEPEPPTPPASPDAPPGPADTAAAAVPVPPAESFALPATLTDTLVVEGDPQPVTLRLVRVDEGALPFATYIPEDLTPEAVASGEGQGHRFVMGNPADAHHASLRLFVPAEGRGLGDPEAYARSLAGEGVALEPMGDAAPWVEAGYRWHAAGRFGSVRAGTRNGRRFYVVEDVQEEMGDGFGPRAAMVLDHWLWLPDGAYLIDPF